MEKERLKTCLPDFCPNYVFQGIDSMCRIEGYCNSDPEKYIRRGGYVCIDPDCKERKQAEENQKKWNSSNKLYS